MREVGGEGRSHDNTYDCQCEYSMTFFLGKRMCKKEKHSEPFWQGSIYQSSAAPLPLLSPLLLPSSLSQAVNGGRTSATHSGR